MKKQTVLFVAIFMAFAQLGFGQTLMEIGNKIVGEADDDKSGRSISLSADGKTIAIGAPENDNATSSGSGSPLTSNVGHVRVYRNIDDTWTQLGEDIDGESASDQFGTAVAMSDDGTIVAVGAPYGGTTGGHVPVKGNMRTAHGHFFERITQKGVFCEEFCELFLISAINEPCQCV